MTRELPKDLLQIAFNTFQDSPIGVQQILDRQSYSVGFCEGYKVAFNSLESENAALKQQIADMGEVIKELKKQ